MKKYDRSLPEIQKTLSQLVCFVYAVNYDDSWRRSHGRDAGWGAR